MEAEGNTERKEERAAERKAKGQAESDAEWGTERKAGRDTVEAGTRAEREAVRKGKELER